jgi:hypothetical protein
MINDIDEHERRIIYFLDNVKAKLPERDVALITEFAEHDEWGLAYETLCDQIYGYNIPITNKLYEEIVTYGKSIQIDETYYLPLKELITSD